jgi:hypothetical protein
MPQILYLAFCNSPTHPLPTLSREAEKVHGILIDRALRTEDFTVIVKQNVSVEIINQDLKEYGDRMALFHFSGHAGRDHLGLYAEDANAKGIAMQLGEIAKKGDLKLVVLNGCSTLGQVVDLETAGVPAVVATNAPVEDSSATEFSIRFFANLSDKRMTIREAYEDALGPAQTATPADLRAAGRNQPQPQKDSPVWDCIGETHINPLPVRTTSAGDGAFSPNDKLTEELFEILLKAGNASIADLDRKAEQEYVETGDKQTLIVNVLPNPVGSHLQKLLCPTGEEEKLEGWDKMTLRRLEQMGWLYHTTVELLGWIMLSQLWELRLDGEIGQLPDDLNQEIRTFFHLTAKERREFDYVPFIRKIRQFFDSLHEGNGIAYFVEELSHLKEVAKEDHPFARACDHLLHLHRQAQNKRIREADIPDLCRVAEDQLCHFFSQLGFLHRYELASIKDIDIQRYRHERKARFNHKMVPLMRAIGVLEEQNYLFDDFIDNRGVALLKWKNKPRKPVNQHKKQFEGGEVDYLNLSPFLFDKNAFGPADKGNLLAFEQYLPGNKTYSFKNVKKPYFEDEQVEVRAEGDFEVVHLQLEAFRKNILGEE